MLSEIWGLNNVGITKSLTLLAIPMMARLCNIDNSNINI